MEVSLRFRRPYFVGTLHYLLYIPRALLADTAFRQLAGSIFSQGRGGEFDAVATGIVQALREIWPGFYHRNIAPEAVAYFQDVFPIAEDDALELARDYLMPLI